MAIFGNKKEKKVKKETKKLVAPKVTKDVTWVLRSPRITEKAAIIAEKGVYVFNIDSRATKSDVALAIADTYKVAVVKVNIAKEPSQRMVKRTKAGVTRGVRTGTKKAYITLQKGDTIQFV
jgi:large subunit ribosomal protein L23